MASSADLIMLYLAIETTSIPLYLLAGFLKGDDKSTEAGFKYMLFGALTSAVLLYGFTLIYGFTGQTGLYYLAIYFENLQPGGHWHHFPGAGGIGVQSFTVPIPFLGAGCL